MGLLAFDGDFGGSSPLAIWDMRLAVVAQQGSISIIDCYRVVEAVIGPLKVADRKHHSQLCSQL